MEGVDIYGGGEERHGCRFTFTGIRLVEGVVSVRNGQVEGMA